VGPDPGPAQRAQLAGQRVAPNRAIMRLSFDQHAALVLREFGGLTYEEVARVLGVSVGAVLGPTRPAGCRAGRCWPSSSSRPWAIARLRAPGNQALCPWCGRALDEFKGVARQLRELQARRPRFPPGWSPT
jgi:hypothetical protein